MIFVSKALHCAKEDLRQRKRTNYKNDMYCYCLKVCLQPDLSIQIEESVILDNTKFRKLPEVYSYSTNFEMEEEREARITI